MLNYNLQNIIETKYWQNRFKNVLNEIDNIKEDMEYWDLLDCHIISFNTGNTLNEYIYCEYPSIIIHELECIRRVSNSFGTLEYESRMCIFDNKKIETYKLMWKLICKGNKNDINNEL